MPPRTVVSSKSIGQAIKSRRVELGYTIEEAASRAGVGSKTWARYEAGSSIRADKLPSILKTLKWNRLPDSDGDPEIEDAIAEVNSSHEAWSPYLAESFGKMTAIVFALGYDLIMDYIRSDLRELASMPAGTHIGQLDSSWLAYALPSQFLMRYDYEFMYALERAVHMLQVQAHHGRAIVPHTVLDEIAVHLIETEGLSFLELGGLQGLYDDECPEGIAGELCGDIDMQTFLYSSLSHVEPGDPYHFDHWNKRQFWTE